MDDAFYRHAGNELRQGDIAFAHINQVVPRNAQREWPGPKEPAELPSYGDYHELDGPENEYGYPEYRVRVWPTRVVVLTQGCELKNAHPQDSRVLVAPIVSKSAWDHPELWKQIEAGTMVPGFFYLPELTEEEAKDLGLELGDLGPAVVDLAAASLASRELVGRRRIACIAPPHIVVLQDAVSRAFTVRGLASTRELEGLEGRTIISAHETALTSPGPVRLVKIHVSGIGAGTEDELTVAWGLRDVAPQPKDEAADTGPEG